MRPDRTPRPGQRARISRAARSGWPSWATFPPRSTRRRSTTPYRSNTYRCCLLRTLMSYKGVPTEEGGAEIHPDLAASEPTISDDGLTWTFTIKSGVHYGDPFGDVEVTAQDFIRALERAANPKANIGGYPFYYSVIEGFDDFSSGDADSISGLSAPDDCTLVIKITDPVADISYRFGLPATAPIPPNGDAGWGQPRATTKTTAGSWCRRARISSRARTRIDFSHSGRRISRPRRGLRAGSVDRHGAKPGLGSRRPTTFDSPTRIASRRRSVATTTTCTTRSSRTTRTSSWTAPSRRDVIRKYQTNPISRASSTSTRPTGLRYISFNFLVPPFDDIHVRKAFNWALDKEGMRQLRGGRDGRRDRRPHHGEQPGEQPPQGLRPVRHTELVRATSPRPRMRWRNPSTTRTRTACVMIRSARTSWR